MLVLVHRNPARYEICKWTVTGSLTDIANIMFYWNVARFAKKISKMISHIVFQCWQQLHKLLYVTWLHSCHLISIFLLFPSEKCSLLKLEPCITPACLLLNIVENKWEPRGVFVLITNWTPLPPPSSFGISQKINKGRVSHSSSILGFSNFLLIKQLYLCFPRPGEDGDKQSL